MGFRAAVGTVVAAAVLAAGCLSDRETTSPFLDQPESFRVTLQGYRKQYRRFKLPTIYPILIRQLSSETARVGVFAKGGRWAVIAGPGWTITTDPWNGRSTRTEDTKLYVWDVTRGTLRARLEGHRGPIVAMDLSRDESILVTAARNGSIRLWDLHRLESLRSLPRAWEEERGVVSLAISGDGRRVAAASVGTPLQVWDTSNGAVVARFEPSGSGMPPLALSPSGDRLAVARRSAIHIIELSTQTVHELPFPAEERAEALAFLPPGHRLAVASGRTVRVVDLGSGEERQHLYHVFPTSGGTLRRLVASADGHQLLSVADSEAVVWDVRDGGVLAEADALPPGIAFASIGESGSGRMLWALRDNSWDVHAFPFTAEAARPSPTEVWRFDALRGDVTQLDFSPDGRLLLAGVSGERHDRTLRILDFERRKMVHSRRGPTLAAFASDGTVIVAHGLNPRRIGRWTPEADDPGIRPIFEPETNTIFRRLLPRAEGLLATGYRPEGSRYFGELWDATAGQRLLSVRGRKVDRVAAEGRLAVVVGRRAVELVDLQTGAVESTIETYLPGKADLSLDGGTLVVGDAQGPRVSTFDLATGEIQCDLEAHPGGVSDVRMLPDGRRAVSGGRDGTARVWDLTSCAELQRFDRHRSRVFSLAVSADGRWLATGSRDEVCLWRLPRLDVSG